MTTVSIIGRGTTKEDAIQDALRNAVEKATWVFVYSTTQVENFQLVKDKIVTASRGYVKDYKITEDKKYGDIIILTANVTINEEAIKSIVRKELKSLTYDDALKDYILVKHNMEKLKKSAELLKSISSRPLEERYIVGYNGYEIKDIGLKKARALFKVKIWQNPFFWNTYYQILDQLSNKKILVEDWRTPLLWKTYYQILVSEKDENSRYFCAEYEFGFLNSKVAGKVYEIHKDLMEFTVKANDAQIIIRLPDGDIAKSSVFTLDEILYDDGRHSYDALERIRQCEHGCRNKFPHKYNNDSKYECIPKEGLEVSIEHDISDVELIKSLSKAGAFLIPK